MATFNEFRNSFPESSNEKGERFEIFLSEWMFKHHPALSSQFKKVWRFSEWPGAWSQKDLGTDLIAEDQHGKICAIQAKFYKEKNSIPKSHIDSFLSDSNREGVDYRLLIATTDNLGPNARKTIEGQEKEVQTFLLHHFLEPFEWPESIDSLEDYQPRQPHQPRPHQQAAIDDVCAKIEGRGQLLMACGTGKTLTGQRITEALDSKTTLVLLPSLLLLSKTVADWVSEREKDFVYLPVCSDKSATKKTDEVTLNNSELCFRSTTDPTEIARFLKRPERKVVFSTYQSSPQIAEAFKTESLKPFDLIIADEAHRCAGKVSSDYSTVLSEDLIPAKKRLFMTATPRTYSSRLKQNAMDAEVQVASMDDEQVFGPVLHHLTFGQAIENDPPLLTDYRVVVVGVNDALVREQVEERALVKTESGLEDDARSLAIQIGLSKAIKDYDLKRVISFHGRVNYASDFAASFLKLQEDLKPESKAEGVTTYGYVSGSMPTSQRTRELRALGELANEDRYIVGNARCLSEGVDVPALDGVAFVDPKRSEIDIVQAVGRAIRLAEGKSFGTIVIPVFISDSEDPDEILSTSEFDQVWKVVNALKSHDEALGETLDEMRVGLGRRSKVSLSGTKVIFDVPKDIDQRFIEAFETKLIETSTSSWEFWFGLLLDFIELNGHSYFDEEYEHDGHKLGLWAGNQRQKFRRGALSDSRIEQLESSGFIWEPLEYVWQERFTEFKNFVAENGHGLVNEKNAQKKLRNWVSVQRLNREKLPQDKILQLDKSGFIWNSLDYEWNQNFQIFKQLIDKYEDNNLSSRDKKTYPKIASWVRTQRKNKATLENWKMMKLNQIGFDWRPDNDRKWDENFAALTLFFRTNGHTNVTKTNNKDLAAWCERQRRFPARLLDERKSKLLAIGFKFEAEHSPWDERLELLKQYKSDFGHCNVKQKERYKGVPLGLWVSQQRLNKNSLSSEQITSLEAVGFAFDAIREVWNSRYALLKEYASEFGHANVKQTEVYRGVKLGVWLTQQRQKARGKGGKYGTRTLEEDKRKLLEELGVDWNPPAYKTTTNQ
jgi:superfamily II DNA or RNA helicase